jgi:hypothetical protein
LEKVGGLENKSKISTWIIPWHNTDECCSKKSLVVEVKDKEPNPNSKYDYENNGKI